MIKRIIFFTDNLDKSIGGMEIHQQAFIDYYSKNDCEFYIIAKENTIKIYNKLVLVKSNLDFNSLLNFLVNLCNNNNIFFFNNLSWIKQIPLLKKTLPNNKYVIRSGGNDILRAPYENDDIDLPLRQIIITQIINESIDYLIINSVFSFMRNKQIGVNQNKMLKIRGGVDYDLIHQLILNKHFNRRSFDVTYKTSNKKLLSIICRLVDFKGIVHFLDYYAKINHSNYVLLIAGSGNLSNVIREKLLNTLSEQDYLFLGAISHSKALEYISISDVVINPSIEVKRYFGDKYYIHTETMGRTMLEAICCNIPLLASTAGATKEIFAENQNIGLCVSDWLNLEKDLNYLINVKHQSKVIDYSWNYVFSIYNKIFGVSENNN